MRILIVDDEPSLRRLLEVMLQPYGQIDLACDGNEALASYLRALETETPYDLICLDIMMPGMDGQQALKEIRRVEAARGIVPGAEVKIIMISCQDTPSAVIEAYYRGGCSSYLVKPVNKAKLLSTIRDFALI